MGQNPEDIIPPACPFHTSRTASTFKVEYFFTTAGNCYSYKVHSSLLMFARHAASGWRFTPVVVTYGRLRLKMVTYDQWPYVTIANHNFRHACLHLSDGIAPLIRNDVTESRTANIPA